MNKWGYNNEDWHKYNLMTKMRNIVEIITNGKHDFRCDYGIQPNRITLGVNVFEQMCLECGMKNPSSRQRIKELLITVDNRHPNKIELEYDENLAPVGFTLNGNVGTSGYAYYPTYEEENDFGIIAGQNIPVDQTVVFGNGSNTIFTTRTDSEFVGIAGQVGIMGPPGINSAKQ